MLSKREWLVMYLCEGFKTFKTKKGDPCYIVGMANTDEQIIKWFIEGLEIYYNFPRTNLYIRFKLWVGMDEEKEHKYWSELLGIPYKNYWNPTWVEKGIRFDETKHGLVTVKRCKKEILAEILSDINQLKS